MSRPLIPSHAALSEEAKQLKVDIGLTNYPAMFVQNAKLQRQLIKVEKTVERMSTDRAASQKKVSTSLENLRNLLP